MHKLLIQLTSHNQCHVFVTWSRVCYKTILCSASVKKRQSNNQQERIKKVVFVRYGYNAM